MVSVDFPSHLAQKKERKRKESVLDQLLMGAEKKGVSKGEILDMLMGKRESKAITHIPLSIFQNEELSLLEATVVYLKDEELLTNHQIGIILGRSDQTVWYTYNHAKRKRSVPLEVVEGEGIPVDELKRTGLSLMERVVAWLRKEGLRYRAIGELLNRDERTVWTAYSRAKKKMGRGT